MRQVRDVNELSAMSGLPADEVGRSLEEAQNAALSGDEDRFGRSWAGSQAPHGGLYYIRVTGALYHTQGGLEIDDHARVIRRDGDVFSNMFAGGGSARSVSGSSSWGYLPAMGLTTAVTLGCVAGQNAAKVAQKSG